jgi:hypothetical protein
MEYKVFDNILPNDEADKIENTMLGSDFPWYIGKALREENKHKSEFNDQFVHLFFAKHKINSNHYDSIVQPILKVIRPNYIVKIKANLHWKTASILNCGFHSDHSEDAHTALYYVNTNNGFTFFENGDKINSVKNRLLIFNSKARHTGTTSTDVNYRCVINIIFNASKNGLKL